MLDLSLFSNRIFSTASFATALLLFSLSATGFLVTQTIQLAYGKSPLAAGFYLAPMAVVLRWVGYRPPRWCSRA